MEDNKNNAPPDANKPHSDAPQSGADLSHFKRTQEVDIPPSKGNITESIETAVSAAKTKLAKNPLDKKAIQKSKFNAFINHKFFIPGAFICILLIAATIGGVIVSNQMARRQVIEYYESGNYPQALGEMKDYLESHPNDHEIAFSSAKAALKIGDTTYAAKTLKSLQPYYTQNLEFLFYQAIINIANQELAINLLNKVISTDQQHVSARFLRAVLLAQTGKFELAREDFLSAESAFLNAPNFNSEDMLVAHQYILQQDDKFIPRLAVADLADNAPMLHGLSALLNVPISAKLYHNYYLPIFPDAFSAITGDSLIGLYYTLALIIEKQYKEAMVELSKIPQTPELKLASDNLSGIVYAFSGEIDKSIETFNQLLEENPNHPALLGNLSSAMLSQSPSRDNVEQALPHLDKIIQQQPGNFYVRSNRAFLRLLTADFDGAQQDVAELSLDPADTLSLLVRLINPHQADFPAFDAASSSKESTFLHISRALAVGDYDTALQLTRNNDNSTVENAKLYARYLMDVALPMRAYIVISRELPPEDVQTLYQQGRIYLYINNLLSAKNVADKMKLQNPESPYTQALEALYYHHKGESPEQSVVLAEQAIGNSDDFERQMQLAIDVAPILIDNNADKLYSLLHPHLYELSPQAMAIYARAIVAEEPQQAANIARQAVLRYPYFNTQYHAGLALTDAGETEEAITILQTALQWQPVNINLLLRIKDLQTEAEKQNDAALTQTIIDNILRYVKTPAEQIDSEKPLAVIPPKDAKIISSIQDALKNQLKPNVALDEFDRLFKDTKEKSTLLFQRGTFLLAVHLYAEAEADFKAALAGLPDADPLDEKNKTYNLYLSKALETQRKYQEAFQVYDLLARNYPDFSLYRRLAGKSLNNAGDIQQAIEYMQKTIQLYPANIENYFTLTEVLKNINDNPQETINTVRQASRVAPLASSIYSALSRLQIQDNVLSKENSYIVSILTPQ